MNSSRSYLITATSTLEFYLAKVYSGCCLGLNRDLRLELSLSGSRGLCRDLRLESSLAGSRGLCRDLRLEFSLAGSRGLCLDLRLESSLAGSRGLCLDLKLGSALFGSLGLCRDLREVLSSLIDCRSPYEPKKDIHICNPQYFRNIFWVL